MNTHLSLGDSGTILEVDATPITLRLPAGAALFAVRGEAWITQEGTAADIIVGAGDRFDVPTRRPLVISATRDRVQLFVASPAAARRHAARNVHEFARDRASELRTSAQEDLAVAFVHGARMAFARLRSALAPRRRLPTH